MSIKPVIRDFFTGVLAIVGLLGAIAMMFLFGEFADTGKKFYNFTIHVNSASGLTTTSVVTLNGVKVGQVTGMSVVPPPGNGAEVKVKIYEGTRIPAAAIVAIEKGFVGDASLEFQIPAHLTAAAIAETIQPDTTFEGGDASSGFAKLASALERPLSRFSDTADRIDTLAATYTALGQRLNEMVEPRSLADVEGGKDPNIRSAIARADAAMRQISRLLDDDHIVGEARASLARANALMDEVSTLGKAWTQTATSVDAQVTKVSDSVQALTSEAAGTLRATERAATELGTTLEAVNKGQGTVGQLVNNPDLYNALRDAAQRLDRALTAVQLLVEKYRAEGIPLRF